MAARQAATEPWWTLDAYGLRMASDIRLPGMRPGAETADLVLELVDGPAVVAPPAAAVWTAEFDGRPFAVVPLPDGAHAFTLGDDAGALLAPGGGHLRWWASDPGDPVWLRVLLDTILFSAGLVRGRVALHAGAVVHGGVAVALAAGSGQGKSTLALELMRRGDALLTDDVVVVEPAGAVILAHPGPPQMNVPDTVPAAERPGRILGRFPGELWVEVAGAHRGPIALGAVVLLDRTGSGSPRAERLTAHHLTLSSLEVAYAHLQHLVRHRFEILATVAERVPLVHLTGGPEAPPAVLADALEEALAVRAPAAAGGP